MAPQHLTGGPLKPALLFRTRGLDDDSFGRDPGGLLQKPLDHQRRALDLASQSNPVHQVPKDREASESYLTCWMGNDSADAGGKEVLTSAER